MRDRRRNKKIIVFLVGILILMSIGYAAFQTQLDIKGTTNISSQWSIRIISADVLNINGDAENVKNTYTDLTANLEANLYNKGDYIEYKIIVENNGDFDAKLETLGITNSNNEAVKITSSGFTKGQTLYKNTSEELIVKIAYNSDYEGDAEGTSGESNITLGFSQSEGGTIVPTKDHLVTYDYVTNGGESTTAENEYIAEGSDINLSYTASKTGYDFIGWNTNSQAGNGLESLTMGTEDITLFAIFKAKDTTPPVIDNISYTATSSTITVVVSAHDDETDITKYEYSIDGGKYVESTENTYTFTGLTEDTSHSIKVRVTNEVGLQTEDTIGGKNTNDLIANVITSGDGLYADSSESGRYIYRGITVNNYITFNDETWRIISVESNGTLKIIRNEQLSSTMEWDAKGTRDSSTSTYCTNASSYGCNAWAATTNLVGTPSVFGQYFPNGNASDSTKYSGTVTGDASLNTYLNGTYYSGLSSISKANVVKGTFNVSTPGNRDDIEALDIDAQQEKQYQWKGYIALATVTEYLKASTSLECTSLKIGFNVYSESICSRNNWLWPSSNEWTLSPLVVSDGANVWGVFSNGFVSFNVPSSTAAIRPVIFLASNITLSGEGTQENPFEIVQGIATPKLEKPTFMENYKAVTINYPSGCGNGLSCSYQKDSGDWVDVSDNSVKVDFSASGTIVAKVSDETNEATNTYNYIYNADITAPVIDNISYTSTSSTITVAVSAHDDESGISKYEYSIDDGEYVEGSSNTYTFIGLTENTSYKLKVRVTNEEGLTTENNISGGINLKDSIVTSGDGLYSDSTEEERYIYRGANPNNYINFNEEVWRIIAVESDGTLKIIRNSSIGGWQYDSLSNRTSSGYCAWSSSYGCNLWGSQSNIFNSNGEAVTSMPMEVGGSSYELSTNDSSLNTYLNGDYYNNLTDEAKSKIVAHNFNVGALKNDSSQTLTTDVNQEKEYKWYGKIGLMNATDYVKASTNSNCTNVYNMANNSSCYNESSNYNWLFMNYYQWTLSPYSHSYSDQVWVVYSDGNLNHHNSTYGRGANPVVYLNENVTLSGSGTSTDPYTIKESGVPTQKLEKPTFSESGTTTKTVTIKYPSGCGSTLTCTYSQNGGSEIAVTSATQSVTFTASGTLVASVTDGTNITSSSYTVVIPKTTSDLKLLVVTSGNGLYADSVTSGRYIYRGTSVNNYIIFNEETWRIISVESNGTLKIIRNTQLSSAQQWDVGGTRDIKLNTYCASNSYGCNAWASTSNLVGTPHYFTQYSPNGNNSSDSTTYSGTVRVDSSLNTYLNGDYYNSLTSISQSQIVKGTFNVSTPGNSSDTETLEIDAQQEKQYQWQGYVALMTATELLRASTASECTSLYASTPSGGTKCVANNWLWPTFNTSSYEWTLSPYASNTDGVLFVNSTSGGYLSADMARDGCGIRPVLHLSSDITLSGSGTSSDPYTIN